MTHTNIACVILPVYDNYLSTLVRRPKDLTTMIWGWQKNPHRMAGPATILKKQPYLPFVFSPTGQDPKRVTHAAICGLIIHRTDPEYAERASWLRDNRVEGFAGVTGWSDEVATFYVVTATQHLTHPIPYEHLVLVSQNRPLSPAMKRGYAIVFLPESLGAWYDEACGQWERLADQIPYRR